jgi:2-polyprenyl-3-methyl-5-hydroxy-6-metoxy-1,4-benzoquinol methylase
MSSPATIEREQAGRAGLKVAQPAEDLDQNIVFLSPPTAFQMADEWYEFAAADHFWFQWRFRAICEILRRESLDEPILEVGCGNGVGRDQIEEHYGCRVDGCDVNVTALRKALPARGRLYFYDIHQRRPEWRGHFGTVLLLDTLEHIRQPEYFLQSVSYHLRPQGRLLVNVPALQRLYSRYDEIAGHLRRYNVALLRQQLRAAGFSIVHHAYWGATLLPVALARKWMLRMCSPERTIRLGFQPGSKLADRFLRGLMHIECRLCPRAPLGTSLVALAEKGDQS